MYAAIWSCAHPCTMKLWRCLCDVFQRQLCHNTCSVKRLNDWAYYDSIRAFCMSQYYFTWCKCEIVVLNGCKIFKAIKVTLYLCNNENTVYTCTVLCQSKFNSFRIFIYGWEYVANLLREICLALHCASMKDNCFQIISWSLMNLFFCLTIFEQIILNNICKKYYV